MKKYKVVYRLLHPTPFVNLYNKIIWYKNNNIHRDNDLPAIYGFEDKKLTYIYFLQNGMRHRMSGPSYINFWLKNKIYYYKGQKFESLEELYEYHHLLLMREGCL